MDDKHILVSLGDEKVKHIGEVIGNKSCNRILDFLAEEDGTVSDISRKLKMPLNTVDYNVKKLVESGLIEKASHWWSVKGKKMPIYRVSNRKIIISPKKSISRVFAWAIGLTGLAALTIRSFMDKSGPRLVNTAIVMEEAVFDAAPKAMAMNDVAVGVVSSQSFWAGVSSWEWFLFGAWFAILIFFVTTLINDKRHKL